MAKKKPTPKKRAKKKTVVEPVLAPNGSVADPGKVRDEADPGDETSRRYQYQYAYGVILLAGSATGKLPYRSIWCEHHDDFLASVNGQFDSYQVKTAFPERGPWDLTKDGFVSAIKKFVKLECRFPGKINRFKFVSNARTLKTMDKSKIARSPNSLLEAVAAVRLVANLREPFLQALKDLATRCDADTQRVFQVLGRVDLLVGPGLDDFEASLSVDHLSTLPVCRGLKLPQLNAIRDELIQRVEDASSKRITDPAKHWCCVDGSADDDPWMKAKQIPISVVSEIIQQEGSVPFRFSPANTMLGERVRAGDLSVFEKKLMHGGLASHLETMRRRTVSTESHLLELASRKPTEILDIQNQLECYVQGVCDDAKLQTSKIPEPYGEDMLREVQQRLRQTADREPQMVHSQPYECLIGVAGLLTEECSVWWGPEFDLEGQS